MDSKFEQITIQLDAIMHLIKQGNQNKVEQTVIATKDMVKDAQRYYQEYLQKIANNEVELT